MYAIRSYYDPQISFSDLNSGKDYMECNGSDYLLFWFQVPSRDVERYEFKALIGNNYKISMSEVFDNSRSAFTTARLGKIVITSYSIHYTKLYESH